MILRLSQDRFGWLRNSRESRIVRALADLSRLPLPLNLPRARSQRELSLVIVDEWLASEMTIIFDSRRLAPKPLRAYERLYNRH